MPIKLPKGFQRRKSSGNVLDEVRNPPEQSFRVFERPGTGHKSLDGSQTLRDSAESKPAPPPKTSFEPKNSFEDHEEDLFSYQRNDANNRGSGGTDNSRTAPYDSASTSTRMSTISTNPSSTSIRSAEQGPSSDRPYNDIPVPPAPKSRPAAFLRTAGGRFSFGSKSHHDAVTLPPPMAETAAYHEPALPPNGRDRAATASSASTATPPKLFDSDMTLDSNELDGFSNMFDNIGNRSLGPSPHGSSLNLLSSSPMPGGDPSRQQQPRSAIPTPLNIERNHNIESSPYSWTSHDGLLRSPSPTKTVVPNSNLSPSILYRGSSQQQIIEQGSRAVILEDTPDTRRPTAISNGKSPSPLNRGYNASLSSPEYGGYNQPRDETRRYPPSAYPAFSEESRNSFDSSLGAEAELVSKWEEPEPVTTGPKSSNKVMTAEQFERYRQQQDRDRGLRGPVVEKDNSDDDADPPEEDDEVERDRKAVQQRRKQEAHLAVYRQSMMKVTGEQSGSRPMNTLSSRLANLSSGDLSKRTSYLTTDSKISGKSSDEEEDEDIPLGILAAHGFPNRHRPPTRLTSVSSPSLQTVSNQAAPSVAPSVAESSARRGSLPAFARHLPQDPYFGAGLVNPSNREGLAMGGGSSVTGVPPTPNMQPYPVHPSGLVGVIASEERTRAMRRGSPNTQGNYDGPPQHPGIPRSHTTPSMGYPEIMVPGMPMPMTPGEMQMTQQMNQMMQMQAQWMQQMQQMMGSQGQPMLGPQGQLMMPPIDRQPGMLAPPYQLQRPMSLPMPPSPGAPAPRSNSMLNLNPGPWNRPPSFVPQMNGNSGGGYAASLAPSERSNVGLAPRYRPVSMATDFLNPTQNRSSTFTSGTIRPVPQEKMSSGMASNVTVAHDEDDDDQGWKEMKAKRDKKKSGWKLKKAQTGLSDLFPSGM